MPRSVKFDFYKVVLPDGSPSFSDLLAGVYRTPPAERNVDRSAGFVRLEDLRSDRSGCLGTMIRGREEDLPVKTDRIGGVAPLDLAATEALGEETSFLFRSDRAPILVLQVNRDGVRAGSLADYVSRVSKIEVLLEPLIDPDAAARLDRMTLIRSFTYRVAPGDGLRAQYRAGRALETALDHAERLGAVQIEVYAGLGRTKGGLIVDGVRQLARGLLRVHGRHDQEITKVEISGREEAEAPLEVIDLIRHRIVARAQVDFDGRSISREDCWRVLRRVYDSQEAVLREMFPPRRR